jgi:tRNA threonylcarbamoyladenosine modification (KEOPS) complex Cgi121 subunit
MIEQLSKIKTGSFIVKEASSGDIAVLLNYVDKANKTKGNVIQAFDYNSVISKMHLFAAYTNALLSFNSHSNKAKTLPMEMLLFAAMTDQIGVAIKKMGAKEGSKIVVFANNKRGFDLIKEALQNAKDFKPSAQHTRKALAGFGINAAKDADKMLLQKMAMSRLKP